MRGQTYHREPQKRRDGEEPEDGRQAGDEEERVDEAGEDAQDAEGPSGGEVEPRMLRSSRGGVEAGPGASRDARRPRRRRMQTAPFALGCRFLVRRRTRQGVAQRNVLGGPHGWRASTRQP